MLGRVKEAIAQQQREALEGQQMLAREDLAVLFKSFPFIITFIVAFSYPCSH